VRTRRIAEDRLRWAEPDDAAEVHDADPAAPREVARDREVMRDENDRPAELVAQREEQVEQADADGYVDHRHRLVGDDHARVDTERARDRDALALSAGELVRVLDKEVRGRREADA